MCGNSYTRTKHRRNIALIQSSLVHLISHLNGFFLTSLSRPTITNVIYCETCANYNKIHRYAAKSYNFRFAHMHSILSPFLFCSTFVICHLISIASFRLKYQSFDPLRLIYSHVYLFCCCCLHSDSRLSFFGSL